MQSEIQLIEFGFPSYIKIQNILGVTAPDRFFSDVIKLISSTTIQTYYNGKAATALKGDCGF